VNVKGKTQTTAWLTDAVYERLRQAAFSRRVTQSAVIEEALVALLGSAPEPETRETRKS
jgi:predicted transcriptional regulator